TVQSSVAFLNGAATGLPRPATLARGVLHAMTLDRIKRTVVAAFALAIVAGGTGWLSLHIQADEKSKKDGPQSTQVDSKAEKPAAAPAPKPAGPVNPQTRGAKLVRNQNLHETMQRLVDLERPLEAELKDVVEFLSDRMGVTIV